jgi:hypothetical protein
VLPTKNLKDHFPALKQKNIISESSLKIQNITARVLTLTRFTERNENGRFGDFASRSSLVSEIEERNSCSLIFQTFEFQLIPWLKLDIKDVSKFRELLIACSFCLIELELLPNLFELLAHRLSKGLSFCASFEFRGWLRRGPEMEESSNSGYLFPKPPEKTRFDCNI